MVLAGALKLEGGTSHLSRQTEGYNASPFSESMISNSKFENRNIKKKSCFKKLRLEQDDGQEHPFNQVSSLRKDVFPAPPV